MTPDNESTTNVDESSRRSAEESREVAEDLTRTEFSTLFWPSFSVKSSILWRNRPGAPLSLCYPHPCRRPIPIPRRAFLAF